MAQASFFCPQCQTMRLFRAEEMNHTPHILASVFLCGLWLPIWALTAATYTPRYHCSQCGFSDSVKYLANPRLKEAEAARLRRQAEAAQAKREARILANADNPSAHVRFTEWINAEGNGWKIGVILLGIVVSVFGGLALFANLAGSSKQTNQIVVSATPSPMVAPTSFASPPVDKTKAPAKTENRNKNTTVKTAIVISENANLRDTPNQNGMVISTLPEGIGLTVIKQNGAWFYVEWGGIKGWVHGNTIRLTNY